MKKINNYLKKIFTLSIFIALILTLTSFKIKTLSCKVINSDNIAISNAEIIIADYNIYSKTNNQGYFFIDNKKLLKDFKKNTNIYIEVRATNYKTKIFRVKKSTHLEIRDRLKPFLLEQVEQPKNVAIETERPIKTEARIDTIKEIFHKQEITKNVGGATTNNIENLNNQGDGTIHVGTSNSYTINEGDKIIETTIIKEKIVEVVPFKERDCAKKEIGYLKLVNKNNTKSYNIKVSNLGKTKGPFIKAWDYYNIATKATKFIRMTSENYYILESENASGKSGMYTQGFSDSYFKDSYYINPCDTHLIAIP